MPSLRRDLRSQLEKTVLKGRDLAEQGALEALTTLGVDQAKPFDHLTADQKRLRNQLRSRGRQAGDRREDSGRQALDHLTGVVAYEHWHRMLFARFLAENGLLIEPEHQVAVSLADVAELARDAKADIWELAGTYAQRMLPAVFRADDPVLALPLARETRTQLERLVGDLPRDVFLADDSLGWTYQFWQAKRKEEVNASGVKIGADEISPVTQLFTEDYMVEFLLHNTLGAWHAGKVLPTLSAEALAKAEEADVRRMVSLPAKNGLPEVEWTYLRFIRDEPTKQWKPAAGTFEGWPKAARQVTFLDPCMGSGHFAVFALPLLARLRLEEEQLDAAEAVAATLRDNIHGLELDERCTQIAAFNLALTAWKLGGYQPLPPLHLACSGLAPHASEKEWVSLAGSDEKLQRGMARLYRLFQNAPVLGSLINPRADEGDLLVASFHELQPLLEKALVQETKIEKKADLSAEALAKAEMAVTARGLAKAAEILAGQFTLVATNVPYLARGKQDELLKQHCERVYLEAKSDLATCFVERCLTFCEKRGSTALVTPQNWLFLGSYKHLRQRLLRQMTWDSVVRLGEHGFDSSAAAGAFTALLTLTHQSPLEAHTLAGLDASAYKSPAEKAVTLSSAAVVTVSQNGQLDNPDSRVRFEESEGGSLLSLHASTATGMQTFDLPRFLIKHWEVQSRAEIWWPSQSTVETTLTYGGLSDSVRWEHGRGDLCRLMEDLAAQGYSSGIWRAGSQFWGSLGILVSLMREMPTTLYLGTPFNQNAGVLIPKVEKDLLAIYCFCESGEMFRQVRAVDQSLKVTNGTVGKIPFDLAHWQRVAAEKYPNGLPKPHSDDPTQWLFNGHPKGSDQPLHVAVARLLGYQWPRQTGSSFPDCPALGPDGLEALADQDGIVCLSPLRGERAGADRLRALLSAALGNFDERSLIRATDSDATSLEDWLRDEFFAQHCALFHQRPFVWHIWDGRKDGFHALANYHQLAAPDGGGRKRLETLTFSYLGDWIRQQQDGMKRKEAGAEDRFVAAQALQKELEAILAGEPPYDLFVRWKPLHQQPIGWEPDINDGVRLNIRPFMLANDVGRKGAGVLRAKPGIKWDKDRGSEPNRPKADFPWFWTWDEAAEDFSGGSEFEGCRWNACHYTPAAKRAARAKVK
jgi:hypothetical protein